MTNTPNHQPTVLTCAQPTSILQLGNYLGAIQHWVKLQQTHECFFGIVDWHAMTMPYTPAQLRANSLLCAAQYIACGLNPEKANIFLQSQVNGHTELAWILGCLTPIGQLERMTQFKDKSRRVGESVGAGLLFYPVLQAADILLYNADCVPVGDDQKQHLELARDIAQKFNNTFSDTFKLPEPYIGSVGSRIMSLQDPSSKMSKSDPNTQATVFLFEPIDNIRKKIMSAVTDSDNTIKLSIDKPGISNLMHILSLVSGRSIEDIQNEFIGQGYAPFKAQVADAVIALIEPMQKKYNELINNKDYLLSILKKGSQAAQHRANRMLSKVYRKTGLLSLDH